MRRDGRAQPGDGLPQILHVAKSLGVLPDLALVPAVAPHPKTEPGMIIRRTTGFTDIATLSEGGWLRPMDARDRYYPMIQHSDPVHAVWARVG